MPPADVTFQLSDGGKRISFLQPLIGACGWITLRQATISGLEPEEELIFAAVTDAGEELDGEQCRRLFDLKATVGGTPTSAKLILRDSIMRMREHGPCLWTRGATQRELV